MKKNLKKKVFWKDIIIKRIMTIDKKYIDQIINVTSKAAIASSYLVGKKDKIAADQAAVDAMRSELNKIDMTGEIVIGVFLSTSV